MESRRRKLGKNLLEFYVLSEDSERDQGADSSYGVKQSWAVL